MDRLVLSNGQWEQISGLIIGRPDQCGPTGRDNRMFVEGVLWIVRAGSPWRSARGVRRVEQRVPPLQPLEREGVWQRLFEAMSDDPECE
jgi:putative transposase